MSDTAQRSLRGRLLVASPSLVDPNFRRAVVLMLEHSPEGALGLVLNRPTELVADDALPPGLAELLPAGELIHEGGPVQPEAVIVLADYIDPAEAPSVAFDTIGIVDPDSAETHGAARLRAARAFGGYAGWAEGQLEKEIQEEAWIDALAVPEDVFTQDPTGLWGRVLDRKGGSYRLVARMPEDPSLN